MLVRSIIGQTVFVGFQPIFEYILGKFAEIEVEITTFIVGVLGIKERIQKPELNILYVALLEVCVVETSHYAAPAFFRICQVAFCIDIRGIKVVGTAFVGIE